MVFSSYLNFLKIPASLASESAAGGQRGIQADKLFSKIGFCLKPFSVQALDIFSVKNVSYSQ